MRLNQVTASPIVVNLHGLRLAFQSPEPALSQRFAQVYGHLPPVEGAGSDIFISWQLHKKPTAPPPPPGLAAISESELVSYYGSGDMVAIRMPKYGLIAVDLASNRLSGAVTGNCLEVYGAFEDVLMIALAPLYRRRGWFPLHAFAALAPGGKAALITGQMGSGKTTTGLALLDAGWKLLSNDSPLLAAQAGRVGVLAYPGRLSAFDDSLARFERLRRFIPAETEAGSVDLPAPPAPTKRVFRAEDAFSDPWASAGEAGAVFFPKVTPGLERSQLVEVASKEAILTLMPQALEGWDKRAIGQHLHLLRRLVEQAPCYILRLSPHVEQLPALIAAGMEAERPGN